MLYVHVISLIETLWDWLNGLQTGPNHTIVLREEPQEQQETADWQPRQEWITVPAARPHCCYATDKVYFIL